MAVHLTPEQAKKLGIDTKVRKKPKTTSKVVPAAECSKTQCCTCYVVFDTTAEEDRHVNATRHARYRSVL